MSFRDIAKGRLQLLALGVGCCFPFFCVPHSAQADDEVESHACPWGRQAFQCLDIQPTIPGFFVASCTLTPKAFNQAFFSAIWMASAWPVSR